MGTQERITDFDEEYRRLKNLDRDDVTSDDYEMAKYIARKCRRLEYATIKTAIKIALRQNQVKAREKTK
ncbi:hypothetical protein [Alkalihalobacillus sp. AL-G]|uniref:hypothetical protein n=1 Tax=Alkalihalobacillus sp. AL-G TaxID=2926399 RepID=UPI00272C6FF3|nr:hypothetical protein [Alkalihalobacillus sp. AL-G]WLD91760.1 hypothetical protein MOJ78_11995 [Alkalihalobacillus sp. AL-G]